MSTALPATREAPRFGQPWPVTPAARVHGARRHGWSFATITAPATAAGSIQGSASLPRPRTPRGPAEETKARPAAIPHRQLFHHSAPPAIAGSIPHTCRHRNAPELESAQAGRVINLPADSQTYYAHSS